MNKTALTMAFTQKPIKENIKPTIWQYLLQYKRMICSILLIIVIIIMYINYSKDAKMSNGSFDQTLNNVKLTVPVKELSAPHRLLKPENVTRDIIRAKREGQNPLEREKMERLIRPNKAQQKLNPKQENKKTEDLSIKKHANQLKKHMARNKTFKNGTLLPGQYFTPIQLNLTQNISYTQYETMKFDPLRLESNKTCDYLSLHGLSKSGTTCLQYILKVIINQACTKQDDNDALTICQDNHVGQWSKHQPLIPKHYNKLDVNKLYKHYPNMRFCVVTVFRDLRDRIISWAYFHFRKDGYHQVDIIQKHISQHIRIFAREIKVWFNFFGNLEINDPLQYFNIFYEDLVNDKDKQIERLINYIGLNKYLNEMDISNITQVIDWDILKMSNVNTFRSKRNEQATICQMHKELSLNTINMMHSKIEDLELPQILLRKLNETCIFPSTFFHT